MSSWRNIVDTACQQASRHWSACLRMYRRLCAAWASPIAIVLFGRSIGSLYAVHGVSRHPQVAGVILESGIANITERFFMRVQPAELGMSKTALVDELQRHFDYAAKLQGFQVARWYCTPDTTSWSMYATRNCSMPRPRSRKRSTSSTRGHNDIFYRNRQAYMQQVETFLAALAGIPDHC